MWNRSPEVGATDTAHASIAARSRRGVRLAALTALLALAGALGTAKARPAPRSVLEFKAVSIPGAVRDSMNAIWTRSNRHWNELSDENTLTQMLGAGQPTQREYLGCLRGTLERDTLWVTAWLPALNMKQLQFAVTGNCGYYTYVIGTWHTHPYRADPNGGVIKERGLSRQDLQTFAEGRDRVVVVIWDVDSLDAAARAVDGSIIHPIPVVLR